jgi:hypothetical protein
LHHEVLGMSHHTDTLKRSLNLYSPVKTTTTLSEMAVKHHILNSYALLAMAVSHHI